jgi:hypothetical protein
MEGIKKQYSLNFGLLNLLVVFNIFNLNILVLKILKHAMKN